MHLNRRVLPMVIWLAGMLACLLVIVQTHFVADLSAFMPRTPNERQQLLIDQLRDGAVARVMMMGIEGGDAAQRARLSRSLADSLQRTGSFISVQNGQEDSHARDLAYFFDNRYLLSPAITPAHFEVDGLRAAVIQSIDTLSGNAGMALKRLFPRDPTGETMYLLDQFSSLSKPLSLDGVWASHDGKRALLLAFTRAPGSDTEAQSRTVEQVRAIFNALPERNPDTQLVMSGAGVSSAASRDIIRVEVERLATASFVLVACLLLAVYRSPTLLLLGLLPVLSGVAAGIATVSLGFGQVHGLTLGFGTTLIGEAVDYSIYFFIQRHTAQHSSVFWRTIWLGVLASIVGFAALLSSSFPGLAQLGLYSISGLVAAVLVTRYVLPILTPSTLALRDLNALAVKLDVCLARVRTLRWLVMALTLAACATILLHDGGVWNHQLAGLNPVPKSEQQLDEQLRSDLGGNDTRFILALTAADQEGALQKAERAGVVLHHLINAQVMAGFNSPAAVLPSVALQHTRQASIPEEARARSLLQQAVKDLPVSAERLGGFLLDLQAAQQRPPLLRADLDGTSVALMVDSMLVSRPTDYLVLMPLRPMEDGQWADNIPLDTVHTALQAGGLSDAVVIDMLAESGSLFDGYRREALWLSGLGCISIVALLLISLRSVTRTLLIVAPLACAVVCVTAALLLSGTQLTILHLVGLLLVVAVGSNYALFFDRGAQVGNDADRQQTQISLVVANLTSVGSFALLGLSKVPVLAAIGSTVAPGAFLALVFAGILTRERVDANTH